MNGWRGETAWVFFFQTQLAVLLSFLPAYLLPRRVLRIHVASYPHEDPPPLGVWSRCLQDVHGCQWSEHFISPILQARYSPDAWKGAMDFRSDVNGEVERLLNATDIRSSAEKGYSQVIASCSLYVRYSLRRDPRSQACVHGAQLSSTKWPARGEGRPEVPAAPPCCCHRRQSAPQGGREAQFHRFRGGRADIWPAFSATEVQAEISVSEK